MRTEQQQRMLDSLRERIKRDKETGFKPTRRGLGFLNRIDTHVASISNKKPTPEEVELNNKKRRVTKSLSR